MKKDIQLIWDFDDTIVKTSIEFDKTNQRAAEMIAEDIFGHTAHVENIKAFQRKLDLEMVDDIGFLPNRYLLTWHKTYEYFLHEARKTKNKVLLEQMTATVMDVYERKYENIPESIPVLKELKSEGFPMIILTAGVEEVQKRKVVESGAHHFVEEIHVFTKKTPQTFKKIMEQYPYSDYVMIGNSLKSDIHPALENDAWGFHYEQMTWEADQFPINRNHEKYIHLTNLKDVPVQLERIIRKKSLAI